MKRNLQGDTGSASAVDHVLRYGNRTFSGSSPSSRARKEQEFWPVIAHKRRGSLTKEPDPVIADDTLTVQGIPVSAL
jgi:hypothetical protein